MTTRRKLTTLIAIVAVATGCALLISLLKRGTPRLHRIQRNSFERPEIAPPPADRGPGQAEQWRAGNAVSAANPPTTGALRPLTSQTRAETQRETGGSGGAIDVDLGLVPIPAGSFVMGSPKDEKDRRANEGPQVQVTIDYAFWMSKCEVTLGQYRAVVGSAPRRSRQGSPNLPALRVTWLEATNFCYLLTLRASAAGRAPLSYEYRLPTEAEWEYACRAGTSTRFSFGDDLDYTNLWQYAWFGERPSPAPHMVGSRRPNPWGLYDMHGNGWEYCLDWLGSNYSAVASGNPLGRQPSDLRAIRGGSWLDSGAQCRSASRAEMWASAATANVGFRVVLAPALSSGMRLLELH